MQEGGDTGFGLRVLTPYAGEHSNAPHPLGLLRARRERPRDRRTAEKRAELAPADALVCPLCIQ
jgi:hypothetical protein